MERTFAGYTITLSVFYSKVGLAGGGGGQEMGVWAAQDACYVWMACFPCELFHLAVKRLLDVS